MLDFHGGWEEIIVILKNQSGASHATSNHGWSKGQLSFVCRGIVYFFKQADIPQSGGGGK